MEEYIIGIDQSTQGTKALLFDGQARLIGRTDAAHRQKVSPEGFISHDPVEIYENVRQTVKKLLEETAVQEDRIRGIGISNQRETTVAWNRDTGKPVCDAIVWQCARAKSVCADFSGEQKTQLVKTTGIPLSPYFPAAKMRWILRNCREADRLAKEGKLCMGTVDSWLLWCLSGGKEFKTDYSNASRTQLFNLRTLSWDEGICRMFGIPVNCLPKVCDSNSLFCFTDFGGILKRKIPVHAVLGDSHGALFGQGCRAAGEVKATYGTGSSLMMNTGDRLVTSAHGIVTSLAWRIDGKTDYVLEGNLNYTGAVISWLKDDLGLIGSAAETETMAFAANREDMTCLVPAFSGLGAPYWDSGARAMLCNMNRSTGKNEVVKAALECISYQITDLLKAMESDSGIKIDKICADGGPVSNRYLMQHQSDMAKVRVCVPDAEELSGIGAAWLCGITQKVFEEKTAFANLHYHAYVPEMEEDRRKQLYGGWLEAVQKVLH